MEYLSYQPDQPPAPCLKPESVQLADPDTGRLLVAPESERPEPNCPLQITENTPTGDRYQGQVRGVTGTGQKGCRKKVTGRSTLPGTSQRGNKDMS